MSTEQVKWNKYKVVFEALSPISIGYGKLGFVKLTRHYIPAKNIWAATIQYLTEFHFPDTCLNKNYKDIEKIVEENIRFSYFFLTFNNKVYQPVFDKAEGLRYGDNDVFISAEEFQSKFIYSYASTAIDPEKATAQEDMLHEVEYINWRVEENGSIIPIYFTGYLWIKNSLSIKELKQIYNHINVGGERSYGFGRLKNLIFEEAGSEKFDTVVDENPNNSGPKISGDLLLNNRNYLNAHMSCNKNTAFSGILEPVVGREWNKEHSTKGAGRHITQGKICLAPGTYIENPTQFFILNPKGYYIPV